MEPNGQAGFSIRRVAIRGDGVAARCCAHLLRKEGFAVSIERSDRLRVPAIMIADTAAALIADIFGRPDLFASASRISRRVVLWGAAQAPVELAHSAAVVSETVLLESLGEPADSATPPEFAPDFTIHASQPPPEAVPHRFGSRRAWAAKVEVTTGGECCIEAVDNGWLFLIPNAHEDDWLLAIGASPEVLLAHSRFLATRVTSVKTIPGDFSTCPRILRPLYGERWLACGTGALAFDPICGDGTAQAVREAILAVAVVRRIAAGGAAVDALEHYQTRLLAAMRRHLTLCAEFYRSGGFGPWWKTELNSLLEGVRWCDERLSTAPPPRYRLQDFELLPLEGPTMI